MKSRQQMRKVEVFFHLRMISNSSTSAVTIHSTPTNYTQTDTDTYRHIERQTERQADRLTCTVDSQLLYSDSYCQTTLSVSDSTGWAKKRATLLLIISSSITVRLSKFFHWHTLQTICNNAIITYPTTP